MPIWRRLDAHCTICASRRALPSAGSRIAINSAMMAITTSSSTSVNPNGERFDFERIGLPRLLLEIGWRTAAAVAGSPRRQQRGGGKQAERCDRCGFRDGGRRAGYSSGGGDDGRRRNRGGG